MTMPYGGPKAKKTYVWKYENLGVHTKIRGPGWGWWCHFLKKNVRLPSWYWYQNHGWVSQFSKLMDLKVGIGTNQYKFYCHFWHFPPFTDLSWRSRDTDRPKYLYSTSNSTPNASDTTGKLTEIQQLRGKWVINTARYSSILVPSNHISILTKSCFSY